MTRNPLLDRGIDREDPDWFCRLCQRHAAHHGVYQGPVPATAIMGIFPGPLTGWYCLTEDELTYA